MQRISSGRLRGRKLLPLPAAVPGLRPTASRIREAMFDRIGSEVADARVLDLFGGSGALAIEALSRGAESATLIECDTRVHRHLGEQLRVLGLLDRARVVHADALQWLTRTGAGESTYDLVFVDPPFASPHVFGPILELLATGSWLTDGALVVCERERIRGQVPELLCPPGLEQEFSRVYGQVTVELFRCVKPVVDEIA